MSRTNTITTIALASFATMLATRAQSYDLSWYTIDGGGGMFSAGGTYSLGGTIAQSDAGPMTGGQFEVQGGFWAGAPAGVGVPAATVVGAVSRKANPAGPGGFCDLPLVPPVQSEPRQGGVSEVRIAFDTAPGGPGANPVAIEQATCAAPAYVPYSGASTSSATVAGNELVLTFTPGLENARIYRINIGPEVTSISGQSVEVSGLVGDVNSDGLVNATDRSVVVSAWTGGGFSCPTDLTSDGATNATDRSVVVSAWTSGQNCAP